MGEVTPVHVAILLVAGAVMLVFVIINFVKNKGHNTPVMKKTQGRALEKRINDPAGGQKPSSRAMYYVTFNLANGETVELGMWDDNYKQIHEGDFGDIIYKGKRLISFDKVEA